MQHASIYIASTEAQSGTMIIAIGFMEMLKGRYTNVAFFRPIIPDQKEDETHIGFMREHFGLKIPYEACYGFTESEVIQAFADDLEEVLFEALMAKVDKLHREYDFVMIDGYPRNRFASTFDFDINLKIAKNLGTAFIPVISAWKKNSDEIINEIQIITEAIKTEGCSELATFVNRCDDECMKTVLQEVENLGKEKQVYILPEVKEVDTPTLRQIVKTLDAKMILGEGEQLNHLVRSTKIVAMGVENYLLRIEDEHLIIVPADRNDIILASLLSYAAKNHPNIVGMILSGGIEPSNTIIDLIKDFSASAPIPIFTIHSDSYETAIAVAKVQAKISPEDTDKITLVKVLFDKYVDKERIAQKFRQSQNNVMTPLMFQYSLFEQARSLRKRILLPESDDERILKATAILLQRDIVDIILLGEEESVHHRAAQLRVDISKAQIMEPAKSGLIEKFSRQFQALRASKGLTLDTARDAMEHKNYFATMMLYNGMADGMVSGATHTTADTIRPALQIIKTKPGISIVSSIFFMLLDTKVLVYGDCAVNLDPNAEQLAHIAISSADTAAQFGIEPRVAMLSYSTGDSGSGPDVEKVREATKIAQKMRPDLLIEGPIQYDAAIDMKVARKKLPDSKVAGRATVFVFPDLNTGNNTYKAVQRSTGAIAIGPILQGLKLPVNDLSRGCLVDDIVNTVAITAVQAQHLDRS
ncbi:phosphate acetyltransferase [Sulfurovum sp. NBC37-1]|uniref:phosphate acetyltransferase n=1 Tax=Sulfurovum sp. (strain NBC37-1) TaxID=387093 RepID=UPI0001587967|nr:phosphate acetyltransferase [Sulfurovum sp. NBC37-1]BAF72938.1 phosphate acetyltransferase [Sulfurovum sp. NBC37-1]